jgi:hypothetical protein
VREPQEVSDSDSICQLTTVPRISTSRIKPRPYENEINVANATLPSTARDPAAMEGCSSIVANNDLPYSTSLEPSRLSLIFHSYTTTKSSLPTNMSYARCAFIALISGDSYPEEKLSSEEPTLSNVPPGKFLPCPRPEPQPPPLKPNFCQQTISQLQPMSSITPSTGE